MSQYPTPGQVPPPGQSSPAPYGQGQHDQGQYGQPQYGQPQYPPVDQFGPSPYGQQGYAAARVAKPTGWFVVNWLFFWPIAIYSLVSHWNKIDPAAYSGDLAGAQLHAAKVKKLGIIALCLGIAIIVGQVAYYASLAGSMTNY